LYLASTSFSSDYPTTLQSSVANTLDGQRDGVVSYFAPDGTGGYSLAWSSYLGGSEGEDIRALAVDSSGTIHIGGRTGSSDFPVTGDAYQANNDASNSIGFVARLTTDAELMYGSYFPRSVRDIAVDDEGSTYLIGNTGREGFPITEGAFAPPEIFSEDGVTRRNGNYISKIDSLGDLEHSSWYQVNEDVFQLVGTAVSVDGTRPIVTGWQSGSVGSAHLLRFAEDFSGLLDHVIVDIDNSSNWMSPSNVIDGQIYVAGYTNSSDFETTPGALHPTKNIGADGYIKKYSFGELLPPTISRE